MPENVKIGQKWSVWFPGRQQWLLATVIKQEGGEATLKLDTRYGVEAGSDENRVDVATMISSYNRYRFIAA